MTNPKISIVTPSFNQGQYIEQTILSIIEQDYDNVELIIIDGGSTDNTIEVIKKYENKITYWVSEKDNGQAHAINKGLKIASGDIFNWINSDDFLEPGALKNIAKTFVENPNKKIVCGYTHCFFDETGMESHIYQMGIQKNVADTIGKVEMNQPGSYYRMDAIRSLGGVNESLRYVFDDELWFKFLCKYGLNSVGFTNQLVAHFRLHESSKSVSDGFFEFYKELLNIYLFIAKELKLPQSIIQYLEKEQMIDKYQSSTWDFTFLEKDIFLKNFTNKYKFLLYKDRHYSLARKGLLQSLFKKSEDKLRLLILLGLKLLLPNPIIEKMRNQKTGGR